MTSKKEEEMRNRKELKLNSLSQSSLKEREMSKIYGGNYCATYGDNQKYNEYYDVCSCNCLGGNYNSMLKEDAKYYKTL